MKKTAAIFLVVASILISVRAIRAQDSEFNAEKAFADYQYQQTLYSNAEAAYIEAKTFYKKNPTLQLREEARQKTLVFVRQRDKLMATYLTAVRMQFTETTGLSPDEKATIFSKLDPEVSWYETHMTTYQDGDELATIFTRSDESKLRFSEKTIYIAYDALMNITLSQQLGLRNDHQLIYADLKNYINDRVAEGTLKIDPFNRWLNDTDAVLVTLTKNEANARKKMATLNEQAFNPGSIFKSTTNIMDASTTPLTLLNNYLSELLITIQNQQQ